MIGHGFCCILFELALLLVSYRTATNTVLTSSNKNETAVHGCSPVLSGFCRVVVSQSQLFHVVSALQFVLQCTEVTMVMAVVTIVLFRCHLVFTTKSTGPRQERGGVSYDRTKVDISLSPIFSVGLSRIVSLPPSWFVTASASWGECLNFRGGREWVRERREPTRGSLGSLDALFRVALAITNQDGGSSIEAYESQKSLGVTEESEKSWTKGTLFSISPFP